MDWNCQTAKVQVDISSEAQLLRSIISHHPIFDASSSGDLAMFDSVRRASKVGKMRNGDLSPELVVIEVNFAAAVSAFVV